MDVGVDGVRGLGVNLQARNTQCLVNAHCAEFVHIWHKN